MNIIVGIIGKVSPGIGNPYLKGYLKKGRAASNIKVL